MNIGVDIDNVLTNTTECVIDYINERIPNLNLKMEDIKDYWMESALPPEFQWIVETAFEDKRMWKNVKMIDGAAEVLEKLYKEGHAIYFATATTAENFRKKISFLSRNLSFFPEGYVKQHAISIKKKQLLNVDVMIDDYLNNLTGERFYYSICMSYPWNVSLTRFSNFAYAENWNDIYEMIVTLEAFDWGNNNKGGLI